MSKTTRETKNTEPLEERRAEVERRVAELENELATLSAEDQKNTITWGESEASIAKRISDAARRKLVLPRLIKSGKLRILELERKTEEERLAELEVGAQAAYAALREAEDALRKAQENLGQAKYEHSDTVVRIQWLQRRIKHIDNELKELRGE